LTSRLLYALGLINGQGAGRAKKLAHPRQA